MTRILVVLVLLLALAAAATADARGTGSEPAAAVVSAPYPPELRRRLAEALEAKGPDYRPRTEHLLPDGQPRYTNRLILEDSPYLIQHAHNPVDWYAWGPEAFERARRESKPVFLSIGYSTCHWCPVMERESFEDSAIAEFLNRHYVAIKVDREVRPDIDQVYMTAVQLLTGSGGWPMSSILTPGGETIVGGTYFPPAEFKSLLQTAASLWQQRPDQLRAQAAEIAQAVAEALAAESQAAELDEGIVERAVASLLTRHDELQGGFGHAPKFPQQPRLALLLDQALRRDDQAALTAAVNTLRIMAEGGIHDQVGGGFHRYAIDNDWLVPHFEKMLYDQAQLARLYLAGWRLTGDTALARVARRTLDFVLRDLSSSEGGFYSATDALVYEQQVRSLLASTSARVARDPSAFPALLTALNLLRQGDSGPRQYAARGAVRIDARTSPMTDGSASLRIDLAMRPGWHLNAHRPLQDELIATTLRMAADDARWQMAAPTYPDPQILQLGFQPEPLAIYQGRLRIEATLTAGPQQREDPDKDPRASWLPFELRLQACSDSICLAPETLLLQVPLPGFAFGTR